MRKRIDRFIEDALGEFTRWYVDSEWLGKERDCVNMFAMNFLAKAVEPDAAISELRTNPHRITRATTKMLCKNHSRKRFSNLGQYLRHRVG